MTNNGRKMASRFPCPQCRHPDSRVLLTNEDDSGVIVRRHECRGCSCRWWTAQEPAWIVPAREIEWSANRKPLWRSRAK